MTGKNQDKPINNSGVGIFDYAIEKIARCMIPMTQKYYESEEGKKELVEWKEKRGSLSNVK